MNKIWYHIGNILIVTSLIFYPLLHAYTPAVPVQKVTAQTGTHITIPLINAQAPVVENVDPWNQSVYNEQLKKGVAHAKGTSLPGEDGTVFLFAHSSGMPWELTRYNTIFLRLGELQQGDEITITRNGKEYRYSVSSKQEVDPSQVQYLLETQKNQLILQTCTPIGTSLRRLLIFAEPQ
jgi:sortase A